LQFSNQLLTRKVSPHFSPGSAIRNQKAGPPSLEGLDTYRSTEPEDKLKELEFHSLLMEWLSQWL
jgi:hypothetical protein